MLRKAGLNVVRMNFSHGSYEYHQSVIDHSREAERQVPGRPLAIALDTVRKWVMLRLRFCGVDLSTRKGPRSVLVILSAMQTSQSLKVLR